jgi:hypothetical protein
MPHSRAPSATTATFIDVAQIDALLVAILPEEDDRAFVVRCILGEGPVHHRGANYVLLMLLDRLVGKVSPDDVATLRARGTLPVPMKVPPNLERPNSIMAYPLSLPTAPLELLAPAGSAEHTAMIDCLTDGPPQHALANAAMLWLIAAALARLEQS